MSKGGEEDNNEANIWLAVDSKRSFFFSARSFWMQISIGGNTGEENSYYHGIFYLIIICI
jgi:hypothetical protein